MRILSIVLLAMCCAAPVCIGADEVGVPGEIISEGMLPFSETWDQMVQRDQARPARIASGEEPAPPEIKAIPRGDFPPIEPWKYEPGQEGSPPPPVGSQTQLTIDTNFTGITLQDQINAFGGGSIPPDTMGAVGPEHFMVVINSSVAIYNKTTGVRLSHVALNTFFTVTVSGTTYPRGGAFDPRVLYDPRSARWFAIALEFGNPARTNNHIILAVCRTANPTTGFWDRYLVPVGVPTSGTSYFTDYDTLGVDDNGVYFGVRIFPSSGSTFAKIAATAKATLIAANPSMGTVHQWTNITDMYSTPQPAHNLNGIPSDRAWFVSSDPTAYANIRYRTATWDQVGNMFLTATSVLTTPGFAAPMNAPASGSTTNIDINDMRLQMAVVRSNRLWTCRNVGVNSSGGSSGADRTGCEWLELDITGGVATLNQSGRVHDTAAGNPRFYYFPSVMVNAQGHAVMGFSGSSATEFIGAYCCGRLATDAAGTMGAINTIHAGQAAYTRLDGPRNRWGDYSYTTLDPDGASIWTIQEYATNAVDIWGTWIARVSLGFDTLANDTPVTRSVIPGLYEFQVSANSWAAVGINPMTNDQDIRVCSDSYFNPPYAYSTQGPTVRDFTVTNGHSCGDARHFAQVYYGPNGVNHGIEAEWNAVDLTPGDPGIAGTLGYEEVLDVYEANLVAGQKYSVIMLTNGWGSPAADSAVFVYPPNATSGIRSSATWSRNSDPGTMDELVFTTTVPGHHAIIVTNENAGLALYSIAVGPTPPNDERANAVIISSLPHYGAQGTYFATLAADDPGMSCGQSTHGRSVWHRWTAPADVDVQVDTFGSNYNTVLAVFRDVDGMLFLVDCNDNTEGAQSKVTWSALSGVTYYIETCAYNGGAGGSLMLHLGLIVPDNDNCSNATPLSGPDGGVSQSTVGATKAGNEPTPSCVSSIHNTVWFSFEPSESGVAVLSASGSDFDTVMAVYRGICGGLMQQVACNDDAIGTPPGTRYSAVALNVEAGFTYLVQVGGYYDHSAGDLRLRFGFGPECMSIAEAKQAGIGSRVTVCEKIIQTTLEMSPLGMIFVEEPDRTSGIAISSDFDELNVGTSVTLVGYTDTDYLGNLYIYPGVMAGESVRAARAPVGMTNKAVGGSAFFYQRGVNGGSGPNNIGLYVKVWGRVTGVDAGSNTYWIDDGSNLSYQPGHVGLAVLYQGSPPNVNDYVRVTGFPWLWEPFQTPIVVEVTRL